LVPMGMQEIADELELHESTIARAVQGKYIFTPRGMRTLRHFFTHSLASDGEGEMSVHTVRKKIQALIDKEDKAKPLSDDRISQILLEEGIHCARRTVAKYRTQLKLGNASQRRIHKKS
ncbi:MAG: RNA polymerase sigma-54 factor, partial [Chlamydiia bacterium]|nr:RNA polymerase sigma-54 factor [Chlamydiia bacterium]